MRAETVDESGDDAAEDVCGGLGGSCADGIASEADSYRAAFACMLRIRCMASSEDIAWRSVQYLNTISSASIECSCVSRGTYLGLPGKHAVGVFPFN